MFDVHFINRTKAKVKLALLITHPHASWKKFIPIISRFIGEKIPFTENCLC
jgi:hypothetical protein